MDFGINFGYVKKTRRAERAAELIFKAGFKAVDYTSPVKEDNWKEIFAENLKCIQQSGLYVTQTHGPFNRYGSYKAYAITCGMNKKGCENRTGKCYAPQKCLTFGVHSILTAFIKI